MKKKTFQCPRCIQGKKEGRNGRKGRKFLIYGTQANCSSLGLFLSLLIVACWVADPYHVGRDLEKKDKDKDRKKDRDKVTYGEHVEDGTDHGHEQDGSQLVEE